MSRTSTAVAVVLAALAVSMPAPAWAAPPQGACHDPEPARAEVPELPWAQRLLDLDRTWPHSTGAGVTVAVVDSGVDADHPQLRGKVLPGRDFYLVGELPGNFACESHGTAAASIIAASPARGVGFRGVAPGARILPVRITDQELNDQGDPTPISADAVARGIRYAADQGARVINLSLSGYGDFRAIRDAVAYARAKDALLVAAVGNRQGQGPGTSFPAAYDGVLGVGSVDIAGVRSDRSQVGPYVDLVAPGEGVLAAARVAGHAYWTGTSFAAPFVAGTAALVRAAWPKLTAPQVAARILATADPAPGGHGSQEYGAGVVDPYRAVTEKLSAAGPLAVPAVTDPPVDEAAARELAWWDRTSTGAKVGAGLVVLAIAVAGILAVTLPRGRRRRWLAGRTGPLPVGTPREEPPDEIFLFPPPPVEQVRH
ncbi:type VII secretion-associated serine protease mycosin [Actinophytocola sp.]|jgi:type VII secretion-associated serine protease mycosin|uniref:type VII secretion-associated serine protease mycosin n=1 Tax=Actinophytocola sp. TaxID=1872138 RepID=UPI002ED8AA14